MYLGMAIGWPLVQCNLIVSSAWGVFYYKEVEGRQPIIMFVLSTVVVILGMALLAWFGGL